jgi:hypothetical protein
MIKHISKYNLFLYKNNIVKVLEIYSTSLLVFDFDSESVIKVDIEDISPIGFSYEWLRLLGLKYDKDEHNYHFKHYHWLRIQKFPDDSGMLLIGGTQYKMLEYVHEVQNVAEVLMNAEYTDFDYLENAPSFNFRDWVLDVYVDETIKAISREEAIKKMATKYNHVFRYICELS